jgi:transcriptional regulator with XRE-family HTH domain
MTFGELVRAARLERGISQEALGDAAHLHHTYVSVLENTRRNPSLESIVRIARALEVRPSELVDAYAKANR